MNYSDDADQFGTDDLLAPMAKRNPHEGRCAVCGVTVHANEGTIEQADAWPWWRILCVEHAVAGALDPPRPVDASRLPSLHRDEERIEL